jgi:hypothetical protein
MFPLLERVCQDEAIPSSVERSLETLSAGMLPDRVACRNEPGAAKSVLEAKSRAPRKRLDFSG